MKFPIFEKLKQKKADRKAKREMIAKDKYLRKLRNSCNTLSGISFSSSGNLGITLSIGEIKHILQQELERQITGDHDD